jgi:type IV pilus assembly protein PilN
MIRINLAPTRRARGADRGQQELMVGILVFVLATGAVLFLIDRPTGERIAKLEESTLRLARENTEKRTKLQDFDELKKTVEAEGKRTELVERLDKARATPAYMLRDLSFLLRPGIMPSMTKSMAAQLEANPNRRLNKEFDGKKIWITSFKEKQGEFVLRGGALSDADMSQLALRMQASVYFHDVIPDGGAEVADKDSNLTFYQFSIKGKVAY